MNQRKPDLCDVRQQKNELRALARKKRSEIDPAYRARAEERITASFLSLFCLRSADTLLTYYPKKDEINTLPLALRCRERGIKIAYPLCTEEKGVMTFHYVESEDELIPGPMGLMQPPNTAPQYLPEQDGNAICIVPGLLFDTEGGRLGYGGGYYDRFFKRFSGPRIALALRDFVSPEPLPCGRYDLPIHVLITEKGVTTVHAF
jgi:5-formyltetrahydrofolate cyclo-ligase